MKPLFKTQTSLTRYFDHIYEFVSDVRGIFERLSGLKEDRAIVLVAALFVENALDEYLTSIISDFPKIRDKKNMTFSLKIDLAKSLNLSPSHIFNCAHKIREIRNEFAHNIEIETFSDLVINHYDSIKAHLSNYVKDEKSFADFDFYGIFRDVTQNTVLNLKIYAWNNQKMNEYIRTGEFMKSLQEYTRARSNPSAHA